MHAFSLRPMAFVLSIAALTAASAASAETISREARRQPIAAAATVTSPVSAMPYACDKSELATRIEKRTCR